MPFAMPDAGDEAHRVDHQLDQDDRGAVTNRLSSEAGSSHFQAKPISWSMRTRGQRAAHPDEGEDERVRLEHEPEEPDDPRS